MSKLRGSATKRGDDRYLIRVHVGGGRYKSRTVRARNKRVLERAWRGFLNELDAGLARAHGTVYTGSFARLWLKQVERTKEFGTWRKYADLVNAHVEPKLGHIRLDRIGQSDVQQCVDNLVDEGKAPSAETLRSVLHSICKLAVQRGFMTTNPVVGVALPQRKRPTYSVLSTDEAQQLLDVCRTGDEQLRQLFPIAHLLLHTGLRRGEALGLRWDSVNFDRRIIDVKEQFKKQRGGFGIGDTKTHRRRLVHVGVPTMDVLARHKTEQDLLRRQLGRAYEDRGFVFTRLDGRGRIHGSPVAPNTLRRWLHKALRVAGLPPLRVHDLRDTAATLMIEHGVDLVTVSEQLGHSSIVVTADRYVHPHSTTKRAAADRLAAALSGNYEQSMNKLENRDAI